jgi:hypothetical protein
VREILARLGVGRGRLTAERERFILDYSFPVALRERIQERYPDLWSSQVGTILEGLRSWFVACLHADGKTLGMPSKAVDEAWHEFILMTREYQAFCDGAFGKYLHHSPVATMSESMDETLARTVRVLDRHPASSAPAAAALGVPFLFALDEELGVPDGNRYQPDEIEQLRAESEPGSGSVWSGGSCSGGSGDGGSDGGGGGSCGGGSGCGGGGG